MSKKRLACPLDVVVALIQAEDALKDPEAFAADNVELVDVHPKTVALVVVGMMEMQYPLLDCTTQLQGEAAPLVVQLVVL